MILYSPKYSAIFCYLDYDLSFYAKSLTKNNKYETQTVRTLLGFNISVVFKFKYFSILKSEYLLIILIFNNTITLFLINFLFPYLKLSFHSYSLTYGTD